MDPAQTPQTTQSPQEIAEAKVQGMFSAENTEDVVQAEGQPEVEAQGQEQTAEAGDATQAQPEEVEVDIDGEKYLVPRKIADRFITQQDYTKKSMDVAEMRRVASAEREQLVMERAFESGTVEERNQLAIIDAQLAQYKRVDWQALETDQLLKARAQLDQLRESRAEVVKTLEAKRGDFSQKIQGITQEVIQSGQRYIEQKIPKFDDVAKKNLFAYGINEGYTHEEMAKLIDPRLVVSIWKASQWDALKASQPGIKNKASLALPTVRPGATQPKVSRITQLSLAVKKATSPTARKQAGEAYFAARFGGR